MAERELAVPYRKKIFWGAIWAGVAISIMIQLVLSLLGLSIGLSATPNAAESGWIGTLSVTAVIWWFISSFIAMYFGGNVSGFMSAAVAKREGVMHGLLVWAFSTLLFFIFATSTLGTIIGGGFSMLSSTISAAAQGIANVVPDVDLGAAASDPQVQDMMRQLMMQGPEAINKEDFINLLMEKGNMPREQAEKAYNDMVNAYNSARSNLRQGAQAAADAAATASRAAAGTAFVSFLILVLGAGFAAWGGANGVKRNEVFVTARV